MSKLNELLEKRSTLSAKIDTIWDTVSEEDLYNPAKKFRQEVIDINKEIEDLTEQIKEAKQLEDIREKNDQRKRDQNVPANSLPTPNSNPGEQKQQRLSPTDQVFADPDFKNWYDSVGKRSATSKVQFGASPRVTLNHGIKTLITSTVADPFIVTDRVNIVDPGTYYQPITILDLITTLQTDSDAIQYVREGTHTNNAAIVAEATATGDGTGAKPESAMTFSIVEETIHTLAHWIPVTRRTLADVPQMRGYIERFLKEGLRDVLADEIISGSGTGDHFRGILNTSGLTTQAYSTSKLETLRKARTKVRLTGRATPSAYLMHPLDWEALDLTMDGENRYYFGGPTQVGSPRLWGLPVVEEERMTEGRALCADWSLAVLWDREETGILVSDSHSDFFIRNLIALLAEMRAGFGLIRPAAFVDTDLTA